MLGGGGVPRSGSGLPSGLGGMQNGGASALQSAQNAIQNAAGSLAPGGSSLSSYGSMGGMALSGVVNNASPLWLFRCFLDSIVCFINQRSCATMARGTALQTLSCGPWPWFMHRNAVGRSFAAEYHSLKSELCEQLSAASALAGSGLWRHCSIRSAASKHC